MTSAELLYRVRNMQPSRWYNLPPEAAERERVTEFVKACIDSDYFAPEGWSFEFNADYSQVRKQAETRCKPVQQYKNGHHYTYKK